jgi:hypothetical protein
MNEERVHNFYDIMSCNLNLEAVSWWDFSLINVNQKEN